MHSTLRVEKEKWFLYGEEWEEEKGQGAGMRRRMRVCCALMKSEGMERAGRFQNMQNPDGSDKTECGIHTVRCTDNLRVACSCLAVSLV
eukprot:760121-Hanusia_phi.AAC.4